MIRPLCPRAVVDRWRNVIAAAGLAAAGVVAVATTGRPIVGRQVVAGLRRRRGQLPLLRLAADRQVQRQPAPGGVDLSATAIRAAVPIVVRGVIYGRGRNGSLVAVDAKTGKELWVRENMNGMTSRGMNYWESADGRDQRLIFAMNSLLQELDAKTGRPIIVVRHQRRRRPAGRYRRPRPGDDRQHPVDHTRARSSRI